MMDAHNLKTVYPFHCCSENRIVKRISQMMIDDLAVECDDSEFGSRSLRADAERRAQTTNKGTIDRSMGVNVKGRINQENIHENIYLHGVRDKSFARKLAMYMAKRIVDKRSVEKCPHLNNNM